MDVTAVAVVFIVFSFVALFVKMGMDYSRENDRVSSAKGGKALRVSELKTLVQESVEEANRPLRERVNRLERELRRLKAPTSEQEQLPSDTDHA